MALNLISSIIVFVIQLLINFFLAPFILKTLGDEAYGFLGLTNSIVNYGYFITIAINSVAGRFVAYEYHRGNFLKANKIFSSVLIINFLFSVLICIISTLFILNLEYFINISNELKNDISLTFVVYFINFCLGLFNAILAIPPFVKNKIYLNSIRQAISTVIFALCILLFFYYLPPMIFYAAVSALIASIFVFISSLIIIKQLKANIIFKFKLFRFGLIIDLVKSGIWNSFHLISYTVIHGIDLYLCNIFINAASMGILSVSKAAIFILEAFVAMISSAFTPKFVELFSKQQIQNLIEEIKFSMKAEAFVALAPICVFIIVGEAFYQLWLPFKTHEQIKEIYLLAIMGAGPSVIMACMYPLLNTNIVTNKLFRPAVANFIMSITILILQLIFLKFSDFGLKGVVLTASLCMIAKVLLFDITNAAINLNLPKRTFWFAFIYNLIIFFVLLAIVFLLKEFFDIKTWYDFIVFCVFSVSFCYLISFLLIFNSAQKVLFLTKTKTFIYKKLHKNAS